MIEKTVQAGDPPWLKLAFDEVGIVEGAGKKNNPRVVSYYADAGHPEIKIDEVPWCAAFVGAMLVRGGLPSTDSLAARSYVNWGKATSFPQRGDIVVFKRGTGYQGHVAFFLGMDANRVYHLGGNQGDRVSVASTPKSKVLAFRTRLKLNPVTGNSTVTKAQTLAGIGTGTAVAAQTAHQVAASTDSDTWTGIGDSLLNIGSQILTSVTGWVSIVGLALIGFAIFWTWKERRKAWEDIGV